MKKNICEERVQNEKRTKSLAEIFKEQPDNEESYSGQVVDSKSTFWEEEMKWLEKGDILFKEGENPQEYAYFGWQSSMGLGVMYYGYITGYKEAADTLVDYSLSSLTKGQIGIADMYVFPICFMYRQFMELALKSIYVCFSSDDDTKKEKNINKVSHNLEKTWKIVRPIIEKYSLEEEKKDIDVAEDYILQMHNYQKSSFEFRYPTEKNGKIIHEKWQYIDLVNLKDKMERFYNYYIGISEQIPTILIRRTQNVDNSN